MSYQGTLGRNCKKVAAGGECGPADAGSFHLNLLLSLGAPWFLSKYYLKCAPLQKHDLSAQVQTRVRFQWSEKFVKKQHNEGTYENKILIFLADEKWITTNMEGSKITYLLNMTLCSNDMRLTQIGVTILRTYEGIKAEKLLSARWNPRVKIYEFPEFLCPRQKRRVWSYTKKFRQQPIKAYISLGRLTHHPRLIKGTIALLIIHILKGKLEELGLFLPKSRPCCLPLITQITYLNLMWNTTQTWYATKRN